MKIKKKSKYGINYVEFYYKNIHGSLYNDKGGPLTIETQYEDNLGHYDYFADDGKFSHKLREVKRLASFYSRAYKDLLVLDKKLKKVKLKPDES